MKLEEKIQAAAETIRDAHPTASVFVTVEQAVIDTDGDGKHDDGVNPDTGAGAEPGRMVLVVNDHRFGEAAFDGFESSDDIAAYVEGVAFAE